MKNRIRGESDFYLIMYVLIYKSNYVTSTMIYILGMTKLYKYLHTFSCSIGCEQSYNSGNWLVKYDDWMRWSVDDF